MGAGEDRDRGSTVGGDAAGGDRADDDATALRQHAQTLIDAAAATVPGWLRRCIDDRLPGRTADPTVAARLDAAAADVLADLRELLARDIDDQPAGPLQLLRRAVITPNRILTEAGVPAIPRDEFAQRSFPDDVHGLSPASFAEIDPALHEPGLVWGAAKAHVHLKRRAEPVAPAQRVVALTRDLMDRSKIAAAFEAVEVVRSVDRIGHADLLIVDLHLVDDPAELAGLATAVVGYASHVDEARLAAAAEAGIEALPRSVFFRRLEGAAG